jgi:putative membrane protein
MAGILMYPRLKIYQLNDTPGGKLFEEMKLAGVRMRKIIMTPAMIGTWLFGFLTVAALPSIVSAGGPVWFPLVLSGFHGWFVAQGKKIDSGVPAVTAKTLRMLNEVPAIGMIIIVFLVILKPF